MISAFLIDINMPVLFVSFWCAKIYLSRVLIHGFDFMIIMLRYTLEECPTTLSCDVATVCDTAFVFWLFLWATSVFLP